ncbi:MAG: zinc-binding alcohol dehydrogenase [Chloroflexi bacterium]|nr:zinc-binding alcohol dehydrogenase [Chloroflexota bacterium]
MQRQAVWFESPFHIAVRDEPMPALAPDQVLVETIVSAISAGTELLFYRGLVPEDLQMDTAIAVLAGEVHYPLQYGYACVGRVSEVGAEVPREWLGRVVIAFQPHASHFVARLDQVMRVPDGIVPEHAAFLPNVETAVNLVMDGAPIIGERVAVVGQGIVGLLTTALLARLPLARLVTFDQFALRRERSRAMGAYESFEPAPRAQDMDLTYELSGNPAALDLALTVTGFAGRIVIGSWYGHKRAAIDLGGRFHRSRIRILSSQVSTLAPEFSARWDKVRRLQVAWTMLAQLPLAQLVTHHFPVRDAARAYALLDQEPERALQVLLTYS